MIAVTLYSVSRPNFFDDCWYSSPCRAGRGTSRRCGAGLRAGRPAASSRGGSGSSAGWRTSRGRPRSGRAWCTAGSAAMPKSLGRCRRDLADGGLAAGADVERLAVVAARQVQRGVDERLGDVVDVDEVARDVRVDEAAGSRPARPGGSPRGSAGTSPRAAVDRVEPQVGAGEALLLAVEVEQVRGGDLGDGVVAVGLRQIVSRSGRRRCRRTPTSCRRGRSRRSAACAAAAAGGR